MSYRSECVKKWRKNTKQRMIDAMGGKCQICGYNKCNEVMEFHHLNPAEKEFTIGRMTRANCNSWSKTVAELKKCILLCNRCHGEVHYNSVLIPEKYDVFNSDYENYMDKQKENNFDYCPVCNKKKNIHIKTCSYSCAAKLSWRINWDNIDIKQMLLDGKSYSRIANELGVSDVTVKKRCKLLELEKYYSYKKE